MEPASEWRLIEPEEEREPKAAAPTAAAEERVPRRLIAAIVAVIGTAVALAIWATLPAGSAAVESSSAPFEPRVVAGVARTPSASGLEASVAGQPLIVDIEGAVANPGLHELPEGSRVGDAIAAAGGYAATVDIAAATSSLNLAAKLTDGQQIHVPALGEAAVATAGPAVPGGSIHAAPGALIDLNRATADELDTLPGIGPVTAAKIIDARTEAPFASVDELESRGVVGAATFEKLRDLVTVTP